jgi:hypothetical protein
MTHFTSFESNNELTNKALVHKTYFMGSDTPLTSFLGSLLGTPQSIRASRTRLVE